MARPAIRTGVGSKRTHNSTRGEEGDAEQEDAAATVDVAKSSAGQQQGRIDHVVCIDNPLHFADAGIQFARDAFHTKIDDGRIDLRQQHAERGCEQHKSGIAHCAIHLGCCCHEFPLPSADHVNARRKRRDAGIPPAFCDFSCRNSAAAWLTRER
jgi:hypothetical protein